MDAKTLFIPFCPTLEGKSLEQINLLLETCGAKAYANQINWPDQYDYMPETTMYIAHTDSTLYIKWQVKGNMLRAVHTQDLESVCEDSCVEFFCSPGNGRYWNFEFNCIGTCNASNRISKKVDVKRLSAEELAKIGRYSSLAKIPFEEKAGEHEWELCVSIPLTLLQISAWPKQMQANFYKCADLTATKHYVTWSPISTDLYPTPYFHCPETFGTLLFEQE